MRSSLRDVAESFRLSLQGLVTILRQWRGLISIPIPRQPSCTKYQMSPSFMESMESFFSPPLFFSPLFFFLKADQALGTVVDGNEWGQTVDTCLTWSVGRRALCREMYLLLHTTDRGSVRYKERTFLSPNLFFFLTPVFNFSFCLRVYRPLLFFQVTSRRFDRRFVDIWPRPQQIGRCYFLSRCVNTKAAASRAVSRQLANIPPAFPGFVRLARINYSSAFVERQLP